MELEKGVVLKTIDYQENSKIIYILTNSGIKSAIVRSAKNLKSHTYSYAQPLVKIEFELKKGRYIGAFKILNNFNDIKLNFNKLTNALKIIEICYDLGDHISDKQLFFDFTCEILDCINDAKYNFDIFELVFKVKILYLLGVAPVFSKCVTCNTTVNLKGFSLNGGGMKCYSCLVEDDFIYPFETINELKILYLTKLDKLKLMINNNEIIYNYEKCSRFLELYYQQFLGFISKVNKVLN